MNIEELQSYCLQKPGVEEKFPFDEHTLTYNVMGKIFALCGLNNEHFKVNLKCDPDYAVELRERYDEVQPGYHMNKKHWNTVTFDEGLPDSLLYKMVDHSYQLVFDKLPTKTKLLLNNEGG